MHRKVIWLAIVLTISRSTGPDAGRATEAGSPSSCPEQQKEIELWCRGLPPARRYETIHDSCQLRALHGRSALEKKGADGYTVRARCDWLVGAARRPGREIGSQLITTSHSCGVLSSPEAQTAQCVRAGGCGVSPSAEPEVIELSETVAL